MFYHNTKFRFALAEGSPPLQGGIIAASAMPGDQLVRRVRAGFRQYPYLQHRLFDPQLYLCGLDKHIAGKTVVNLATQPWFTSRKVPAYDSGEHGTIKNYKETYANALLESWTGEPFETEDAIQTGVRACIQYQLDLGCEGIILPSPLTTVASRSYEEETRWLDIGVSVVRELRLSLPIYATVALSDGVLRGVNALRNPLINTITDQIASRDELAGAYVVVEQTTESGYACNSKDVLLALLVISDDLSRGAGRRVIVNYIGTFGAVMSGAGTVIWASGYYRSQRRLRLTDYEESMGLAQPRLFSLGLVGDVGLEEDLPVAFAKGFGARLLKPTSDQSVPLLQALTAGTYPLSTPQWAYRSNNLTAATAHYLSINDRIANSLDTFELPRRREFVLRWLKNAASLAEQLSDLKMRPPITDSGHQSVWLSAFSDWVEARC